MMRERWIIVLLFVCIALPLRSQDSTVKAYFMADNITPLIGQSVNLTLVVELPAGATLNALPDLKSDWQSPFMIKEVGERTETEHGGIHTYQQTLVVISWEAGDFPTPETFVSYQIGGVSEVQRLLVQPTFFKVPSVLNGTDRELHPLKALVWLPYSSPWVIVAVGVGLVIGIGSLSIFVRSRARHRRIAAKASTPAQAALAELGRFDGQDVSVLELYPLVANCLRVYIHRQFGIPAPELTTDELMEVLDADARLPVRLQKDLERLLRQSDLVKFARAEPGARSAQRLLAIARDWIERAEEVRIVEREKQLDAI